MKSVSFFLRNRFWKSTWETRFGGYQTNKWGGVIPILLEQENQKWELISENNSGSQRMPLWQLRKWVQKSLKVGTRSSLLALFAILILLTLPPPLTQSCETKYAVIKRVNRKIYSIDPFPLSDKCEAILVAFGPVLWILWTITEWVGNKMRKSEMFSDRFCDREWVLQVWWWMRGGVALGWLGGGASCDIGSR